MIYLTTRSELKRLASQLSQKQLERASRNAMRDAGRWAKTRMVEEVPNRYNLKKKTVREKLTFQMRGGDATITASHRPVNLASMPSTRMETKDGKRKTLNAVRKMRSVNKKPRQALFVSAEIVKGERKTIETAFMLGTTKGQKGAFSIGERAVIFARGKYKREGFEFGKARKPIAAIRTVSVATAVLHRDVSTAWSEKTQKKAQYELLRQVKRLLNK